MDIEEINSSVESIANTFGIRNQQLKLIEELSELIKEIAIDISNNRDISEATILEIADVNILINQIIYLSNKGNYKIREDLQKAIEYKLMRTIHRIKIGYYDKEGRKEI